MLATAGMGRRIGAGLGVRSRSERAAPRLLALDRLEEGLEVPLAEAPGAVPLDDLEEERGAVLDGLGEDLEQVAFIIAIDEDAQLGKLAYVLRDRSDAVGKQVVIRPGDGKE